MLGMKKVVNHATITAPMKTMKESLDKYVKDQTEVIDDLKTEKDEIDRKIAISDGEIKASIHTSSQISNFLGSAFLVKPEKTEEPKNKSSK